MAAQDRKHTVMVPQFDNIRATKDGETAQLQIRVGKAYNGGSIDVSAMIGGVGGGFFSFMMHADFNQRMESVPAKRVTQKAVDKLFDEWVTEENIAFAIQCAVAHYADRLNRKIERDGYVPTEEQRQFFKDNLEAQAA